LFTDFALGRFEPLVGQAFEIGDGPGAIAAVLIEASNLREAQGVGFLSRQYSLVWRGPRDARLEQGTYTVRHPELGVMELFLVCIGPDAEGMRYEAVFT
jgi:hypothetical protein